MEPKIRDNTPEMRAVSVEIIVDKLYTSTDRQGS